MLCMMTLLAGCYSGRTQTDPLAETTDTLYVKKVELPDDFIRGADISSVLALEQAGVVFHDFSGNEADLFHVLASSGINTVRVRVWNDPFDSEGHGYGGGNCDAGAVAEIGKRAARCGMSLIVDFHYSDFWADPGKQMVPKEWKGLNINDKAEALYAYTKETLQQIKKAGGKVCMVQLGNETNGALCGEKIWANILKLMAAGSKACREVFPKAKVAVHFANPESGNYDTYAFKLDYYSLDYDVFASSYYPFWHGTLDNLIGELDNITEKYGKEVMVMETSYAYRPDDTDYFGNTISDESSVVKNYPYTVQGQTNSIVDVFEAVSRMKKGIGVVYWEPAWITVGSSYQENSEKWEQYGAGWAASYAREYDPADAGKYHGGSAVDNQALFDPQGYPLESLKLFVLMDKGNEAELSADALETAEVSCDIAGDITLPKQIMAIMNDNSRQPVDVIWEETDLEALRAQGIGRYQILGTAAGQQAVCWLSLIKYNFLQNYSFESGEQSPWKLTDHNGCEQLYVEKKATDSLSGEYHMHFWSSKADGVCFDMEQDVEGLKSGRYVYSISIMGGDGGSTTIYSYVEINGKQIATCPSKITSYNQWDNPIINDITVREGDVLTVGIHVECHGAGAWGKIDDAILNSQ